MTLALMLPEPETFDITTHDRWCSVGVILAGRKATLDFMIGDWLHAGIHDYGLEAREEANQIFARDRPRFHNALEVCRRFPKDRRHALSYDHHLAVMPVTDDAEAERLLTNAETHGLTAPMLKAQVRIDAGSRQETMPDDDPEDAAYRRLVHAWNMAPSSARQALMQEIEDKGMGVIDL